MTLAISMILRNEADRHLIRVMENVLRIPGRCYVTDDGSTDDSASICEDFGCMVRRTAPQFWQHEGQARQAHMDWMAQFLSPGDWVLAMDADETINKPECLEETIRSAEHLQDQAISLPLYEFWTESEYRVDGYWFGTGAPVLYRWREGAEIADREMGSGREPTYVRNVQVFRQKDIHLQHWGYLYPDDRIRKHKAYSERLGGHGHDNGHVNSIITEPILRLYEGASWISSP
jgi:glycosyltransferase involved in cell wall biosynthesis